MRTLEAVRRVTRGMLAVAAGVSLAGCLYDQPLAPGVPEAVEPRLVSEWRCVAPESEKPAILSVTLLADNRYRAVFGPKDDDEAVFVGYVVTFEGTRLVNAQEEVGGARRKWTLARYTLYRPTLLHIEFARDEPFRNASTQEQRVQILRSLLKAPLFEDYCTCIRTKQG